MDDSPQTQLLHLEISIRDFEKISGGALDFKSVTLPKIALSDDAHYLPTSVVPKGQHNAPITSDRNHRFSAQEKNPLPLGLIFEMSCSQVPGYDHFGTWGAS